MCSSGAPSIARGVNMTRAASLISVFSGHLPVSFLAAGLLCSDRYLEAQLSAQTSTK